MSIGAITNYTAADWYVTTAGIVSFALTDAQLSRALSAPLAIMQAQAPLLAEPSDGTWIRADATVFRLNPGDGAATTFHASSFGKRKSGLKISLASSFSTGSAFAFPASVITEADGTALVKVTASDPGSPRQFIDGQIYGVKYGPGNTPPPGDPQNFSRVLNALVWSGYRRSSEPNLDQRRPADFSAICQSLPCDEANRRPFRLQRRGRKTNHDPAGIQFA